MATMVSEVYDALLEAGASQDKARRAAEAVAGYEARSNQLEQGTATQLGDLKREVVAQRGELNLLKWMVGTNMALTVAVLAKLLFLPSA